MNNLLKTTLIEKKINLTIALRFGSPGFSESLIDAYLLSKF
jgi:hypothetical protein